MVIFSEITVPLESENSSCATLAPPSQQQLSSS